MMNDTTQTITIKNITFRVKPPSIQSDQNIPARKKAIVMLHGWTGDENAMWIFAQRLPPNYWLLAPRGLFPAPLGGFGWHPHRQSIWPMVNDLQPAIESLRSVLTSQHFPDINFDLPQNQAMTDRPIQLVGFSQGAALALTFAILYPQMVQAAAGLSGFLPEDAVEFIGDVPLRKMPILLAHGRLDELVPVHKARRAVELLTRAGAQVDYCEDDVGHKLSITCFRSLEVFFQDLSLAD